MISQSDLRPQIDDFYPMHTVAHAHSPLGAAGRLPSFAVVVRACRPRQWSKNALLLAAPAAAGVITRGAVVREVIVAIVAFCMISSSTYLVNDVCDRNQDRLHVRKRHRPVASGALAVNAALVLAAMLAVGGLAIDAAVHVNLFLVGCGYLALTASYSVWWRRIVVVDILAIASGFVLRAVAGGVATGVPLSHWFLVMTSCGAVFVVAGKRHGELFGVVTLTAGHTRVTLRRYSTIALRLMMSAAAAGAIGAYVAWASSRPGSGPWYAITIVPVVAWLARYAALIACGHGEAPEELILRDPALLTITLTWAALFLTAIYAGS